MHQLTRLLQEHYAIHATSITPGTRSLVSKTCVVEAAQAKYFAKLVPVSRYSANLEASLPVLNAMHRLGLQQINYPVATTDGRLSVTLENEILMLFNFIEGEWTFDYSFEKYVELIARVHQITPQLQVSIQRETFSDPYIELFERQLNDLLTSSFTNPHEQELQRVTRLYAAELQTDLQRYKELFPRLRHAHDVEFVLTHGDAPGNILRNDQGELFLIDWDDVMLAPRERDTWFHLGSVEFLPLYRRTFPNYEADQRLYAFYLYRRYVEDLSGAAEQILAPGATDEEKALGLAYFHKDHCWLRPLVRELDGKSI